MFAAGANDDGFDFLDIDIFDLRDLSDILELS
jgi:hypothetical protein